MHIFPYAPIALPAIQPANPKPPDLSPVTDYGVVFFGTACYYEPTLMCLAIPGKVEVVDKNKATVNFGGIKRQVDLSFLDDTVVGDWLLVHVGFAIQKVDEESARAAYRLLADSRRAELEAELNQLS